MTGVGVWDDKRGTGMQSNPKLSRLSPHPFSFPKEKPTAKRVEQAKPEQSNMENFLPKI
jgi:hypothetical protein